MDKELIINALARRIHADLAGYFPNASPKHDHYHDYGWPEVLTFEKHLYPMYKRNSLANAAVEKSVMKVWEDNPFLLIGDQVHEETAAEKAVRLRFEAIQLWAKLAEADRRGQVGRYSALVFRFADNKYFHEPVDRVPGGLDGLVDVIPAWEAQLRPSQWETDTKSENYGQPTMYEFRENAVDLDHQDQRLRMFSVHPDRVHIWSRFGDVFGSSRLEAGFNDLLSYEKVSGAGGEGFWKNAKQAPVLNVDKDANLTQLAAMLGVEIGDIKDKLDEVVGDWQKGFDKLLMLQGIKHEAPGITLPQPAEFLEGPLSSFSASFGIAVKILIGSQSGERASQEDADEWARTCMARRNNIVKPNIMRMTRKFARVGVLPADDWHIHWSDLTEASAKEKAERGKTMSETNRNMVGSGEPPPYTSNEIREVSGYEPIDDDGGFTEEDE